MTAAAFSKSFFLSAVDVLSNILGKSSNLVEMLAMFKQPFRDKEWIKVR
jgi:hypothetical protein